MTHAIRVLFLHSHPTNIKPNILLKVFPVCFYTEAFCYEIHKLGENYERLNSYAGEITVIWIQPLEWLISWPF